MADDDRSVAAGDHLGKHGVHELDRGEQEELQQSFKRGSTQLACCHERDLEAHWDVVQDIHAAEAVANPLERGERGALVGQIGGRWSSVDNSVGSQRVGELPKRIGAPRDERCAVSLGAEAAGHRRAKTGAGPRRSQSFWTSLAPSTSGWHYECGPSPRIF